MQAALSLLALYLINRWSEFHQIYSFAAVGDKDELIRFWDQKVKGQGSNKTKCGQKRHDGNFEGHASRFQTVFLAKAYDLTVYKRV